MSEQNLLSVAFPTLDEGQIQQLARCTDARTKLFHDGEKLFAVGDQNMSFFMVKSGEVEIRGRLRRPAEDGHDPPPGRVHRRRLAGDRPPGHRHGRRPGRLRSLRGRRPTPCGTALNQPPGPERHHPAGVHRPPAASARVGQLHGPAGDRLPLLPGYLPCPRFPGRRTACSSPGWTWRPTRMWSKLLEAVRGERGRHARGRLGLASCSCATRPTGSWRTPSASAGRWSRSVYDLVVVGAGSGGSGRGRLRRLRGAQDAGA